MTARATLLALLASAGTLLADPDLAPIRKWIAQQQSVRSIQADFVQTRALRTLRNPVASEGKFWFRAPASFRWQIGDPAKTLVLSNGGPVFLIQPGRKTAQKSAGIGEKARAQGMGMVNFPMAASFEEFERSFEVLGVRVEDSTCRLEVLPRAAQARRHLTKIELRFDIVSGKLLSFEIVTREGSSLRNEFRNVVVNARLAPETFTYDLTGYKLTDAKP